MKNPGFRGWSHGTLVAPAVVPLMIRSMDIAVALTLFSAAASAQEAVAPVELHVGYGELLVTGEGGDYTVGPTRPAFHLGATFPVSPRFSIEALTTISSRTSLTALHVTDGIYIVEVKQRVQSLSGDRFHTFLTYGAAGYFASLHQSETTITRPNGTSSTINSYAISHTDPPLFAAIGGGFQRAIGSRSAVRVDAQVMTLAWAPFAVRLSAGMAIPFAEYDKMRTGIAR